MFLDLLDIFPQLFFEDWQEKDCQRADDVLRHYTKELMDNLSVPADNGDLMERGEAFIRELTIRKQYRGLIINFNRLKKWVLFPKKIIEF